MVKKGQTREEQNTESNGMCSWKEQISDCLKKCIWLFWSSWKKEVSAFLRKCEGGKNLEQSRRNWEDKREAGLFRRVRKELNMSCKPLVLQQGVENIQKSKGKGRENMSCIWRWGNVRHSVWSSLSFVFGNVNIWKNFSIRQRNFMKSFRERKMEFRKGAILTSPKTVV